MTNNIRNLFGLQGFKVLEIEIKEKEVVVLVESELEVGVCPHCGKVSNKRHDYYWTKVRDLPVSGKKVFLHLKRIRLYCPKCKRPFLMPVDLCGKKKSYTWRYGEKVYSQILYSTIKDVAREEGLSYGQVARIFRDMRKRKSKPESKGIPSVISLDEIQIKKGHEYATVVSAPKEKRVLNLLEGRSSKKVESALGIYPEEARKEVKAVIIDRWKAFKKVVEEVFPNADIVANRFHLVQDVNRALDKVRKRLQGAKGKNRNLCPIFLSAMEEEFGAEHRRKIWGIRFLLLKNGEDLTERERERLWAVLSKEWGLRRAYLLKERFREALEGRFEDYVKWEMEAKGSSLEEFRSVVRSFCRWREAIRNCYRWRGLSNGFAEGINNKIKVIKRRAYGFRKEENFKERVLAACG